MPELPEVETIRADLNRKILGKKISAVEIRHQKTAGGLAAAKKLHKNLLNTKFTHVHRVGKLLLFELSSGNFLAVHLKMTGQLIYVHRQSVIAGGHSFGKLTHDLPDKHTRLVIAFSDKSKLFFNDARLFGYIKLLTLEQKEVILAGYGLEPLTPGFTRAGLEKVLAGRKTSIKAVLLNQKLIAGIGNIYADEACYAAGILPSRRASTLTKAEIKKLHAVITRVIKLAIRHRGTTFNDYMDSEGRHGSFLKFLKVYGRAGEPCRACKRELIFKKKIAGRGTHWCPFCQK